MVSKEIKYLDKEPAGSDQIEETFRLVQSGIVSSVQDDSEHPIRITTALCRHEDIGCYTGIMRMAEVDQDADDNHVGLVGVVEVGKLNEYLVIDANTDNFPMLMRLSHDIKSYYLYQQHERMAIRMAKRTSAADIGIDFLGEAERLILTDPTELLGRSIVDRKEIDRLNTGIRAILDTTVSLATAIAGQLLL